MTTSQRWALAMLALLATMLAGNRALAAPALPQFLGVDPVAETAAEVTDEHLSVRCEGAPPILLCKCSSTLTIHNPTDQTLEIGLEVDGTATSWSVDGAVVEMEGDKTGDELRLLATPVTLAPRKTREIKVLYENAVRFDGSPESANLNLPGFDLSPPITYRHPLLARPYQRAVAVELWAAGARNDRRWRKVSNHTVQIRVPAGWLIHSTTGMTEAVDNGFRELSLTSTADPSGPDARFKMQAVLAAPAKVVPFGLLAGIGYGWEQSCPSCTNSLRFSAGIDIALVYLASFGLVAELSGSKPAVIAGTLDFSLPTHVLCHLPNITLGAGMPVRTTSKPEPGIRAQFAPGYKLGAVYLGGALIADWFPGSANGKWSLAPMLQLGL